MTIRTLSWLLGWLLFPMGLAAQPSYVASWRYFQLNDEVQAPSSVIHQIFEHSSGRVWIATSNGLYAYNGAEFARVYASQLPCVFRLAEDPAGRLWILCRKKAQDPALPIWVLDPASGALQGLSDYLPALPALQSFVEMRSDSRRHIWFTQGNLPDRRQPVLRWNGSRLDTLSRQLPARSYAFPYRPDSLALASTYSSEYGGGAMLELADMAQDSVLASRRVPPPCKLLSVPGSPCLPLFYLPGPGLIAEGPDLRTIGEVAPGQVPVASNGEVFVWQSEANPEQLRFTDRQGGTLASVQVPQLSGPSLHIPALTYPPSSTLQYWRVAGKGLVLGVVLSPSPFQRLGTDAAAAPEQRSRRGIWSNDRQLWSIGISNTIFVEQGPVSRQQTYPGRSGLGLLVAEGRCWYTTEAGLLCRTRVGSDTVEACYAYPPEWADTLRRYAVAMSWALHRDTRGRVWVGHQGGLSCLDPRAGALQYLPAPPGFEALRQGTIYRLHENAQGLWAFGSKGVFLLSLAGKPLRHWPAGHSPGLPETAILHAEEDGQGGFWLATQNAGLLRWHPEKGVLDHYTEQQGLSSNTIYAAYLDAYGYLWASSLKGLNRLHLATGDISIYWVEQGIAHNEFNTGSAFRSAGGRLYFGGLNGITSFDPQAFLPQQGLAETPFLIGAKLQDGALGQWREVAGKEVLTAPPGTIGYALKLGHHGSMMLEKPGFSYKIEGLHATWQLENSHTLRLGMLPYGAHRLLVRAQDALGNWSEPMVLEVEALAPFYKRWWFLALMLALVASLLYAGHRWQIRRYQRQQRMLEAEIGQRTAHIQAQAQELQVLNAQQARFFSNISHELRTPLTLLCSPIDELLGQLPADTPAEVADSLRSMRQSGAQLIDLVDELLEMARLETGKLRPEPTPCLIHGFLSTLAAPFQTHAGYQHIRFGLRLSVPPDAWLMADERKVGKIIGNLLGNAFKYTPDHGEVVLESWLEGEVWMTAVEDTGMGISAEALPHIFERFYQQDSARAGAGIGLSFAKELADLMGGSLAVSSAPGQGSRFVLSLPAVPAVPPSPEALPERSATAPPIVSGSCILLVEDHAPLRDFTRRLLEPEYRVLTAGNGAEAWDLLQGAAADAQLIISDVVMPELDGFGLLQRVRAHQGNRAVPFIFLTALSAPQHRIKGFATGVDDYLTKPFQPQELRVRVRSLLERYQQRTQAHHEPQEEEEGEDGQQPVAEERPHDEASPQDWAWIQEVEARIREEVGNPSFGIWTLADSMNLSYRQFNRKIKQLTGLSPLHYQREVKLQVARELLEGTSLSLEKVADRVGFSKASYLAKLYRERFGELPHEA